jgi:plasmid stabilization system protein ParE
MKYKLILRQEAERDLAEAYRWYSEKVPGLGSDFLAVVERALESIKENPARFPVIYREVRRALMRRVSPMEYFLQSQAIRLLFWA